MLGKDSLVANGPNGEYRFLGESVARAWGKRRALRGKKRGGNRPRHGLPHDRNYNQSNDVACWAKIHLLPMVPPLNEEYRGGGEKKSWFQCGIFSRGKYDGSSLRSLVTPVRTARAYGAGMRSCRRKQAGRFFWISNIEGLGVTPSTPPCRLPRWFSLPTTSSRYE